MNKNLIIISLSVLVILMGIFSVVAYQKTKKQASVANSPSSLSEQGVVASGKTEAYFDDGASVMFFYSDLCSWCNKEKEVLAELAKEGYKVKPMDVKANPDYWQKYDISGTPTFIAKNGEKKVGYLAKEELKKWLDQFK